MNYVELNTHLISNFKLGKELMTESTGTMIRFYSFQSTNFLGGDEKSIDPFDKSIQENISFTYPVFVPKKVRQPSKAILLMHGLNERNWNKYLTWANYLCTYTGKPVILFPIAFHMNRSPISWSNPRDLQAIIYKRKLEYGNERSISFANAALSERISEKPLRFYSSGRQSMFDLTLLFREIKSGNHPLFREDTQIDIFSYSIGSFLSQITLMTNPEKLFTDSKLFMFCGGSIFSSMFGESRSIMDKPAFNRLMDFYTHDFDADKDKYLVQDNGFQSFFSMISPDKNEKSRLDFFKKMGSRIAGISLQKDIVIPYEGVKKALGEQLAKLQVRNIDFDFEYTHENPFPATGKANPLEINQAFNTVFSEAAAFLA